MKVRNIIMPAAFCLYLAGVALLCFTHGSNLPNITGTWFGMQADKVAHAAMFLPFIPLAYFTFRRKRSSSGMKFMILTALMGIGIFTAFMTEVIQDVLGYRSYETEDFLSDCIGLVPGYVIITLGILVKKLRKRT
jgi:VanZ family protein